MAHNYVLRVTAGPSYDPSTHSVVAVNSAKPLHISSELIDLDVNIRIQVRPHCHSDLLPQAAPCQRHLRSNIRQNYRGLPKNSPKSSPYFDTPPHDHNKDQYSIAFKFTPKKDINANDLVFGNDFDHPIRDRLPPGFGTAMKIVKWGIDPGLDGDPYADEPYLYGPLTSSINTFTVGSKGGNKEVKVDNEVGIIVAEGGDVDGKALRKEKNVPESEAARKKYFLNEAHRKAFDFEAGREFGCDFFNAYLDFNGILSHGVNPPETLVKRWPITKTTLDFALHLPGFTLQIMKYWDGQGLFDQCGFRPEHIKRSHSLRYVLKNRKTNTALMVIVFTLYLKEDILEDGSIKPGVEGGKPHGNPVEGGTEETEAPAGKAAPTGDDTNADDVD